MSFKLLRYDRMTLILCLEEKIILTPALSYYTYQCLMLTVWNIVFGQRKIKFTPSAFWLNGWLEFVDRFQYCE